MPLLVNLHQLEIEDVKLSGELSVAELKLEDLDPMIRARQPLRYALEVQKLGTEVLLAGSLEMTWDCECVRCLRRFTWEMRDSGTLMDLPLEGEEAVPVVADAVDLTPHIREHILLGLPPHPVCGPDCGGLPLGGLTPSSAPPGKRPAGPAGSPWDQLDNLHL